jgi:hypothetical protein
MYAVTTKWSYVQYKDLRSINLININFQNMEANNFVSYLKREAGTAVSESTATLTLFDDSLHNTM